MRKGSALLALLLFGAACSPALAQGNSTGAPGAEPGAADEPVPAAPLRDSPDSGPLATDGGDSGGSALPSAGSSPGGGGGGAAPGPDPDAPLPTFKATLDGNAFNDIIIPFWVPIEPYVSLNGGDASVLISATMIWNLVTFGALWS